MAHSGEGGSENGRVFSSTMDFDAGHWKEILDREAHSRRPDRYKHGTCLDGSIRPAIAVRKVVMTPSSRAWTLAEDLVRTFPRNFWYLHDSMAFRIMIVKSSFEVIEASEASLLHSCFVRGIYCIETVTSKLFEVSQPCCMLGGRE